MGAANLLALVLAVRLVLLLAVIFAFVLALIAIRSPDEWRLATLAVFTGVVVVPMIWLSARR